MYNNRNGLTNNNTKMKIIAKQGSELEKLLKQMNEQLLREQEEAKDMVRVSVAWYKNTAVQDLMLSVMAGCLE